MMIKKLTMALVMILISSISANATDITETSALGTATADDSIITVDDSATTGAKLRRTLFNGDGDTFLSGLGTWVDLTAVYEPLKGTDDNFVTDAEKTDIGNLDTASARAAEDSLTDGSNLPDGAAIKSYGDANWGGGGTGSALEIESESVSLDTGVTKINFLGDGVSASENADHEIDVTIEPDAGALTLSVLEGSTVTFDSSAHVDVSGAGSFTMGAIKYDADGDGTGITLDLDDSTVAATVDGIDGDMRIPARTSINTDGSLYLETTAVITGLIETATDSDAHTLTEAEYHGGNVLATGAGIYTLPTAVAGRSGCVETGYGVTGIIQLLPATGDYLVYHGVRGTAATSIKSDGSLGDKICYLAQNDTDWYISTYGTWSE